MCTSHLKWRDDPAYLLEENDKPSVVGREAALVLCSEKKQLMNHKILPSLGAVPLFFAKSVTWVKKKSEKKKNIGVPRGNLGLENIKGWNPFVCAPHSHRSARRANIFFAFFSWLARLTSLKRKDCLLSKFFTIILSLTNSMTNQENNHFFFFTCTDWHKQDLFLSALAKLPRDPADQSNGLYWNDPLNSYEET